MTERETSDSGGLIVANNERIRSFLQECIEDPNLNKELREMASKLSSQSCVQYISVLSLWSASSSSTRPKLVTLFPAADFIFPSPKRREKGEELQARLQNLAGLEEPTSYNELVEDLNPRKDLEPSSSCKDQLGFGLHFLLTMCIGYLVGYSAFRSIFNHSPVMNAVGGILGLVFALLLETLLLIIRASDSRSTSALKKNQ